MAPKVLMVCLGNICRSPMAEGVLRHLAQQKSITLEIDSAGTGSWHVGDQPDVRAIACMKKKGIDISKLKARQFHANDFHSFDYIFTMDSQNYRDVVKQTNDSELQTKVDLYMNQAFPSRNQNVPDPYFGGDEGFEQVYEMLVNASEAFLQHIQQ